MTMRLFGNTITDVTIILNVLMITTVINIKENKYPEDIINDYLDTLIKD